MRYGSNELIECPACGALLQNRTISSCNTFGAKIYSDGRMYAPMYDPGIQATQCKTCKKYFWLPDAEITNESFDDDPEGRLYPYLASLSFHEITNAIEQRSWNQIQETHLRLKLWWEFNSRVFKPAYPIIWTSEEEKQKWKDEHPELEGVMFFKKFKTEDEKRVWEDNLLKLIALMDVKNSRHQLIAAEALRRLGRFEESIAIVSLSLDHLPVRDVIRQGCVEKDTEVRLVTS